MLWTIAPQTPLRMGILHARILEWAAISFSSGPCFIRTLKDDQSNLVALHSMAQGFMELHKPLCHDKAGMPEENTSQTKVHLKNDTETKQWPAATAAAKSLQWCLTLCDPIDDSPPGSPIPGILQARTLEWVAIFFSNAWKWKVKVKSLSRVWLLVTPWTGAYQAPPSMGFSWQEYWSGVPLPSPNNGLLVFKTALLKTEGFYDTGSDRQKGPCARTSRVSQDNPI